MKNSACIAGPITAHATLQRISAFVIALAIVALSGCLRIPSHSKNFQATLGGGTFGGVEMSLPAQAQAAINDTNCQADFADLIPTDNRFDDRQIGDWGDLDDGCDFYPQNENDFN